MPRLLALLLVAALCQGCFVFDELDKGQKIMEQHSPKNLDAEEPAPTASPGRTAKPEPGFVEGLLASAKDWWNSETQPKGPERDPDDTVVRCELGERTQYTRKSDCQVRGGRIR